MKQPPHILRKVTDTFRVSRPTGRFFEGSEAKQPLQISPRPSSGEGPGARALLLTTIFLIGSSLTATRAQSLIDTNTCLNLVRQAYTHTAEAFSADRPYRFQSDYFAVQVVDGKLDTTETRMVLSVADGVWHNSLGNVITVRDRTSLYVIYEEENVICSFTHDSVDASSAGMISLLRDTLFNHVEVTACYDTLGSGREPLLAVILTLDSLVAPVYKVERITCFLSRTSGELRGLVMRYRPGLSTTVISMTNISVDYDYQQGEHYSTARSWLFEKDGKLRPRYHGYQVLGQRSLSLNK